jgi:hypothetical protein
MSTKNMPTATAAEVATEEQLGHILDQQKRRIRARGLTKDEANIIIRSGNRYLPVMDQVASSTSTAMLWRPCRPTGQTKGR